MKVKTHEHVETTPLEMTVGDNPYTVVPEHQEELEDRFGEIPGIFLRLCSVIGPNDYDKYVTGLANGLINLKRRSGIIKPTIDAYGNMWYAIPDDNGIVPNIALTSHMDTVSQGHWLTGIELFNIGKVLFAGSDQRTILGADDRAGMAAMVYLLRVNTPGVYCFFTAEESGGRGSSAAARDLKNKTGIANKFLGGGVTGGKLVDRMVSLDRYGNNSIITFQGLRTASDKFAEELAAQIKEQDEELDYEADKGGTFTDSSNFSDLISECSNLSIGYLDQHQHREVQDISHLTAITYALAELDWSKVGAHRDPTKDNESKWGGSSYTSHSYSGNGYYKTDPSSPYKMDADRSFRGYTMKELVHHAQLLTSGQKEWVNSTRDSVLVDFVANMLRDFRLSSTHMLLRDKLLESLVSCLANSDNWPEDNVPANMKSKVKQVAEARQKIKDALDSQDEKKANQKAN